MKMYNVGLQEGFSSRKHSETGFQNLFVEKGAEAIVPNNPLCFSLISSVESSSTSFFKNKALADSK